MLLRIEQFKNVRTDNLSFVSALLFVVGISIATNIYAKGSSSLSALKSEEEVKEPMKAIRQVVRVNPTYPVEAKANEVEGYVVISFAVTSNGTVEDIKVIESMPANTFDVAAKKAVALWRFVPSKPDSTPMLTTQIDFKLGAVHTTLL